MLGGVMRTVAGSDLVASAISDMLDVKIVGAIGRGGIIPQPRGVAMLVEMALRLIGPIKYHVVMLVVDDGSLASIANNHKSLHG